MKVGFFDSGLGGLSILNAVRAHMPQYEYLFYGDTANLPYGDKSEAEVYKLTKEGIDYLFTSGAAIAVIACNTASVETLRRLQNTHLIQKWPDRKILGVVVPTVEEIIEQRLHNVLLLGTCRTVESKKYEVELRKCTMRPITFESMSTPQLVPLIEQDKIDEAIHSLVEILDVHIESGGDSVVLGCTHYTLLKEPLRYLYPDVLTVISQDEIIPYKLEKYLSVHTALQKKLSKKGSIEVYLTGERD